MFIKKKKKDCLVYLTYNTTNTYTEQKICASRAAELIVKTMCWVQRKRASKSEKEKKKSGWCTVKHFYHSIFQL